MREVPTRYALDHTRDSITVKFMIYTASDSTTIKPKPPVEGYFVVGLYEDGIPGELFVYAGREGETIRGFCDCWAKAISMMLQHGIPHQQIYNKFKHDQFVPNGMSNLQQIPFCKSIPDLIVKYMEQKFPPTAEMDNEYDSVIDTVVNQEF